MTSAEKDHRSKSIYTPQVRSTAFSHVNSAARRQPRSASNFRKFSSRTRLRSAALRASVSSGSTSKAASPLTSGNAEQLEVTTGIPAAMASTNGMPKPSSSDGKANMEAWAYHSASTAEETYPS